MDLRKRNLHQHFLIVLWVFISLDAKHFIFSFVILMKDRRLIASETLLHGFILRLLSMDFHLMCRGSGSISGRLIHMLRHRRLWLLGVAFLRDFFKLCLKSLLVFYAFVFNFA